MISSRFLKSKVWEKRKINNKFLNIPPLETLNKVNENNFEVVCYLKKDQVEFDTFLETNKRAKLLIEAIRSDSWATKELGQPEMLKGPELRGWRSREITKEDRLVYCIEPRRRVILSWKVHYRFKK